MIQEKEFLDNPVTSVLRTDVAVLRKDLSVRQALDSIRQQGVGERIVYFYVVDNENRLAGVLPTRRLLTAPLDHLLAEVMIPRVITIPHTATVFDACEAFVLHRFLAFPVVDEQRQILGVVDVDILTRGIFDIEEPERIDDVFAAIGFRISEVRRASTLKAFRIRFPWLTATITSGILCALLVSFYELTLARSLVLAFFLTLVLGLGESVSIQSMTVTFQALRTVRPTARWYFGTFRREISTALLLGTACGFIVGLIAWFWLGHLGTCLVIGGSIVLGLCAACFWGLSIPTLLHRFNLDLRIAAGPITLAITDISTLFFYFGIAAIVL